MKKRAKGLVLTLGAVVVLSAMMFLITAFPALVRDIGSGTVGEVSERPAVAGTRVVMSWASACSTGSRSNSRQGCGSASSRPAPSWPRSCWLVASAGFGLYTANFARYSKTYGSLASIVIVLLWLYLSAFAS